MKFKMQKILKMTLKRILNKVRGFKHKLMAGNMKMYGTPLSTTSTTLKYNFDELEKLLKDKLNEQRERMPSH